MKVLLASLLLASALAPAAHAGDARLVRPGAAEVAGEAMWAVAADDGLRLQAGGAGMTSSSDAGPSPALAGLMSAVIPGSGQLAQGKGRGWIYLGVEIASWFSVFALDSASDQAIDDSRTWADARWDSTRYAGGACWNQEDSDLLFEQRGRNPDGYYAALGDQETYVCGWDDVASRARYNDLRSEASSLSDLSGVFVAVIVLNHVVSAIDAAKVAADRRKEREQALHLRVSPPLSGELFAELRLTRRF